MDPMLEREQHHEGEYSNGHWIEVNDYHSSHVHSPAHEYNSFNFSQNTHNGLPMDSYNRHVQPIYSASHQAQPLYPGQWPSMLTNPPHQTHSHMQAPAAAPIPPPLAPASSFAGTHSLPRITTQDPATTPSTARRTLTDQDRRRMCQYHEDHPSVKQTEIGAMFGVERSTVSKVLRQKDKYLFPEDGSRSPIKKAKGKFPDIERALANWAKNHQRQGLPLSDHLIKEKARFFATTVGSSESHAKVNSNSWLEKFKQKNHLMGAKPRKEADTKDKDGGGTKSERSDIQTPNGISPISPTELSPSPTSPSHSRDELKVGSPDSYSDYKHGHSQSATSLASCFTDATAPSSFGGPQSPTSPIFSPDIANGASSYMQATQQRSVSSGNVGTSSHTNSQAFPMLGVESDYAASIENPTPRQMEGMMSNSTLDRPLDEYTERSFSISSQDIHHLSQTGSKAHSPMPGNSPSVMAPPPNPLLTSVSVTSSAAPSPISPPSQEEARRALALVMTFFQSQPSGVVDPQEYITMGKLMEKLKAQGSIGELPGGMYSIDRGQQGMSRKRSIHSL